MLPDAGNIQLRLLSFCELGLMPRLNYGTLLENIVLFEATRLCFDNSDPSTETAFATSFAMPPLTQCWSKSQIEQSNNPVFSDNFLIQLAAGEHPAQSIQDAWGRCMNNRNHLPVCILRDYTPETIQLGYGGPNGALLIALLGSQRSRIIRFWINDDGGRYGETSPAVPSSQTEVPLTCDHGAALVGTQPAGEVTHIMGMFPDTIDDLAHWLNQQAASASSIKVGFLDPDNYMEGQTQVTREQHQRWLRVLTNNSDRSISVMFFACMNRGRGNVMRNHRVACFHKDEIGLYSQSVVFEYGNYQVGVKLRWSRPDGWDITDLRSRVEDAWHGWSDRLGRLTVHENGQPG